MQVLKILSLYLAGRNPSEDAKLVADLGLSSMDVMDVVVAFEEEFQVEIPDRKLQEIMTVADMIRLLEEEI